MLLPQGNASIGNNMTQPIDDIGLVSGGGAAPGTPIERNLLIAGFDVADQFPTALDTPLKVQFGNAQGTGGDPIQIFANGDVQFNEGGPYFISLGIHYGRRAGTGLCRLFFRVLLNGTQVGSTTILTFTQTDMCIGRQFTGSITPSPGDILTAEVVRDSSGVNEGGLLNETYSGGGWFNGASANVQISEDSIA